MGDCVFLCVCFAGVSTCQSYVYCRTNLCLSYRVLVHSSNAASENYTHCCEQVTCVNTADMTNTEHHMKVILNVFFMVTSRDFYLLNFPRIWYLMNRHNHNLKESTFSTHKSCSFNCNLHN